jgi:hypothetical protein
MSRKARIILILLIGTLVGGLVIAVSLPGKDGETSGVSFWDRLSCTCDELFVKLGLRSRKPCIPALKELDKAKITWANKERFDAYTCIGNLKQLEAAKATCTNGYGVMKCPAGGDYVIGSVKEKARCSIPGHTL